MVHESQPIVAGESFANESGKMYESRLERLRSSGRENNVSCMEVRFDKIFMAQTRAV